MYYSIPLCYIPSCYMIYMVAAKQNQKFSLPFFFSSAGGVGGADKKWKGNFWFLLPRPQGADEARRLVLTRIILEKSSDFVQETQPQNKIRFFAKMRSVVKRRSAFWRKNEFYFGAARQGLEPRFLGPKPNVLPLDDPAIYLFIIIS